MLKNWTPFVHVIFCYYALLYLMMLSLPTYMHTGTVVYIYMHIRRFLMALYVLKHLEVIHFMLLIKIVETKVQFVYEYLYCVY